jgi:hypothetical protein
MKSKNDRVPTFFYVPNFFYVFFRKTKEIVGTLSFLPCFFEIFISKKHKYNHFSMSKTFSKFFWNIEKVWNIEKFCNIAKSRKIKAKMTESQHFSMLKFFRWTQLLSGEATNHKWPSTSQRRNQVCSTLDRNYLLWWSRFNLDITIGFGFESVWLFDCQWVSSSLS